MKVKKYKIQMFIFFLVFSVFPHVVGAAALSDITGHKNQTAIQYLYDNGVIAGYPDGTFKPDKTINRAELLKILVGGKGITPTTVAYKSCFPDVKIEWFAPYVCYAKSAGWVSGYPDGTFQPNKTVSKVEAIKMLVNSQGYQLPAQVTDKPYADIDVGEWYAPFLKVAKDKGLLEEAGSAFGTSEQMTRGGISENIYRAMIIKNANLETFSAYNPDINKTPTTNQFTDIGVGKDDLVNTPSRQWTVNEVKIVDDPYNVWTQNKNDKLVGINLTNQNVSDKAQSFSDVNLLIKDTAGNEYKEALISPQQPVLEGGILQKDEKRTGWVTFEVPSALTSADLIFLVTMPDNSIQRIKKPITIPAVGASTTSTIFNQTDKVTFDGFEWQILNVYRVDKLGSENFPQFPKNKYFIMVEVELKNTTNEAKYNGDPILMVGDQQVDRDSTATVYGSYLFNYDQKKSQFEAGAKSKTYFGFDAPDIKDKDLTLILKSWSVNDDRATIKLTDIKQQ